jgi:alkylhydroperoxidase/carboxymuconolactone decarboxylase family protein YurZ
MNIGVSTLHSPESPSPGATDAQIKEAIASAALVREWSTMLNGNQSDFADFKKQVNAAYGVSQ